MNDTRGEASLITASGQKIWLREYAFVAPSQIGRPPPKCKAGPWIALVGEVDALRAAYRSMRKRTRRQSRWYRRNQHEIEARRRRDPKCGLGKNADWARLYPHGRKRILAWREVR
jgi:hypothetical protein